MSGRWAGRGGDRGPVRSSRRRGGGQADGALQHPGVHEGLGQVAPRLALADVVLLPRAGVQLVGQQVTHRPVRVINENVRRAPGARAAYGRVDVFRHHEPAALVVPPGRLDILGIHQPGDAFHVRADVDPHQDTFSGWGSDRKRHQLSVYGGQAESEPSTTLGPALATYRTVTGEVSCHRLYRNVSARGKGSQVSGELSRRWSLKDDGNPVGMVTVVRVPSPGLSRARPGRMGWPR